MLEVGDRFIMPKYSGRKGEEDRYLDYSVLEVKKHFVLAYHNGLIGGYKECFLTHDLWKHGVIKYPSLTI